MTMPRTLTALRGSRQAWNCLRASVWSAIACNKRSLRYDMTSSGSRLVRYGQIEAMRARILAAVPVGESKMLSAEAILKRGNKRAANGASKLSRTSVHRVLNELARAGAVMRIEREYDGPGKRGALRRRKRVLFHRPSKSPPPAKSHALRLLPNADCLPQIRMIVGVWKKDRHGFSRSVWSVAPEEVTAA
jgi:hypothetical protein